MDSIGLVEILKTRKHTRRYSTIFVALVGGKNKENETSKGRQKNIMFSALAKKKEKRETEQSRHTYRIVST